MASTEPPPLDFDDGSLNSEISNDGDIFSPAPKSLINSIGQVQEAEHQEVVAVKTEHKSENNYKPPQGFKEVQRATHVNLDYHVEPQLENDFEDGAIEVLVSDPRRLGENVSAYISYKVSTKTTLPTFARKEMEVCRRFSDFFALYEKLFEKHSIEGRFIPPPPEKSIIGMAKVKVSKEDGGSSQFIERRRRLLERFLRRIAEHPHLRNDPNFVDFLETEDALGRTPNNKTGLSGAAVLRLFHRVGESFNKVTYKMEETDEWFEKKEIHLNTMEASLQSIGWCLENMIYHKKDLSQNLSGTTKSLGCLSAIEENDGLNRALAQLSETLDAVNSSNNELVEEGCTVLLEFVRECFGVVNSAKDTMNVRVKLHKIWKDSEVTLAKKREAKVRMELAYKVEKLAEATRDIAEWEQTVERSQADFEKISRNIKEEMTRLDRMLVRDFKEALTSFLESTLAVQQKVMKSWEALLPEVQNIV